MIDELLGLVTFQSSYHQWWFIGSMVLLLASCLRVKLGRSPIFHFLAVLHGVIVIEATCVCLFGRSDSTALSVHCIWFNGLMTVAYYALTGGRECVAYWQRRAEEAGREAEEPPADADE